MLHEKAKCAGSCFSVGVKLGHHNFSSNYYALDLLLTDGGGVLNKLL